MKASIVLSSLLLIASFVCLVAAEEFDSDLENKLQALMFTLTALEIRASIGSNEFLQKPNLYTGEIEQVYAYFTTFDRKKSNYVRKFLPRVYTAFQAIKATFPNNIANLAGKRSMALQDRSEQTFYDHLTDKYIDLRARNVEDNFESINGTKAYEFVKQSACSDQQSDLNKIEAQLKELAEEYTKYVLPNIQADEDLLLKQIEERAAYLGNIPVAVLSKKVGFQSEEILTPIKEARDQLMEGLREVHYTVQC